jgi:hypothetical protein
VPKLELLKSNVTDEKKRSKLNGLYKYIKNNKEHVVNYERRKKANKTFTSQVVEPISSQLLMPVIKVVERRSGLV